MKGGQEVLQNNGGLEPDAIGHRVVHNGLPKSQINFQIINVTKQEEGDSRAWYSNRSHRPLVPIL